MWIGDSSPGGCGKSASEYDLDAVVLYYSKTIAGFVFGFV